MEFKTLRSYIRWQHMPEYYLSQLVDNVKLNREHILQLSRFIEWDKFSKYPDLTEEFLELCYPFLEWKYVSRFNKYLTLNFIRNHLAAFNKCWDEISRYQTLDENAMTEFADLLNWRLVSRYQTMSPEFIIKYKHRVDWNYIENYQNVSSDFVKNNRPNVDN